MGLPPNCSISAWRFFALVLADPAPSRAVHRIIGVTSQAVVANRTAQTGPRTVRPRYRRTATGEEGNIFTLHIVLHPGLHPAAQHSVERECDAWSETPKAAAEKLPKRAGGPHFFGFQPPQKCVGSLPPSSTRRASCTVASTGDGCRRLVRHT
jgi:hypothetical protein